MNLKTVNALMRDVNDNDHDDHDDVDNNGDDDH